MTYKDWCIRIGDISHILKKIQDSFIRTGNDVTEEKLGTNF
jgi:hypothetical protein